MNDNALAVYEQFDTMQRVAVVLHESGYFSDVKSKAQAIIKVMAGAELGLPPFASMTGIHIIQGKPALGANVIATLVKNDPRYDYRVLEMTDAVCRIEFFENGASCGTSEFTAQDARKAGTKNMDKFPKNMLFARAMSNGAKWFTPGIFGGGAVYTPEELGADVDEDGNVVEGEVISRHTPQPTTNGNGHTNGNGNGHKLPPTNEATVKNQHNAAGVSWEELGSDDSPGTIDPDKLVFYRGKVQSNPRSTVATVCNAAAMTGAYRGDAHAINAALSMNADLERGMKLTTDEALNLFDKLMARKQQPQLVTVDAPQVDAGYAE